MRILIQASQGTGKSTLNNHLMKTDKFKDYTQIDSMSEKFFKKDDFKDLSSWKYYEAQMKIFAFASNEYLNQDDYISSRGFADSYAYAKHAYEKTGNKAFKNIMYISQNYQSLLMEDLHIYIPIEFELKKKALRSSSIDFQLEIDSNIKEFLKLTETNYYTVTGTPDERVKKILEVSSYYE
jgi:hypothetical protein